MRSALAIACVLVCALAAVAETIMPRDVEHPLRPVAIDTLPKDMHGWRCVDSHPAFLKALAGATMVQRTYVNKANRSIDVLLITGTNTLAFHDATVCLPMQGFESTPQKVVSLPGSAQTAAEIEAARGDTRMTILYWRPTVPSFSGGGLSWTQWRRIQNAFKLVHGNTDQSLMVRFIAPTDPDTDRLLRQAAGEWEPELEALSRRHI